MRSFKSKFLVYLIPLVILISVLYLTLFLYKTTRSLTRELIDKGFSLANVFAQSCELGCRSEDEIFLKSALDAIAMQKDVVSAIVYDEKGRVIASFQKVKVEEKITEKALESVRAGGKFFAVSRVTENGGEVYHFLAPVSEIGFYQQERNRKIIGFIKLSLSAEDIRGEKRSTILLGFGASLVIIAIGVVISALLARSFAKPVNELVVGTREISKGNLNYQIEINTKDEFGLLASAFNEMTKKLKKTQEQLIRTERLATIGQLAAGVGHELRNPLSVVKNSVYYLSQKLSTTDEKASRHLEILKREVDRANKIITDLLDFSRTKEPVFNEVRINSIIEDALSRANPPASVKIDLKLSDEIPPIMGDEDRLVQVFLNIILNAIQAMPEGGTLTIETSTQDGSVEVSIGDTGCGIPEENLERIFDPLVTTKAKGIGLGLAVTKKLVESHGGEIEVESRLGEGSTFLVRLPVPKNPTDRKAGSNG